MTTRYLILAALTSSAPSVETSKYSLWIVRVWYARYETFILSSRYNFPTTLPWSETIYLALTVDNKINPPTWHLIESLTMFRSIESSVRRFSFRSSDPPLHSKPSTERTSGIDLIEDWPHNVLDNVQKENREAECKRVTFSDSAACRIYPIIHSYESSKSYTKSDQKGFGRSTLVQAARIKKIISSVATHDSEDTKMSRLLHNGINIEDIMGIEHIVLGTSPSVVAKSRQRHAQAILLEQERQMIVGIGDAERLRQISMFSSQRSVKQARIRGGLLMDGQSSDLH